MRRLKPPLPLAQIRSGISRCGSGCYSAACEVGEQLSFGDAHTLQRETRPPAFRKLAIAPSSVRPSIVHLRFALRQELLSLRLDLIGERGRLSRQAARRLGVSPLSSGGNSPASPAISRHMTMRFFGDAARNSVENSKAHASYRPRNFLKEAVQGMLPSTPQFKSFASRLHVPPGTAAASGSDRARISS